MPTPVTTARQCLTPEAAHALDEAVSVARRRGHGQTTSLHAVSALLSLPSSPLREACARARNSAYSPRLQFKALDLCLSVSLDRVPSTQLADDPPVSNSLMAAIKRSQANQRRQPENFHLYQQIQQQSSSSVSCVKVELQHLILSILDDPIVSRVFAESGFRSSDIKLAILRPLPQLFKYSRTRIPPMFLCNLAETPDPTRRSFSFPFSGFSGVVNGDENCRRIGEVLVRNKGRNPLLVGVCAYDALRNFTESLQKRKDNILPVELSGLNVISIENEVSRFVTENSDDGSMNLRFEEVCKMLEHSLGPGLVVNFGDLQVLTGGDASGDAVNYVVAQLTRLLEIHGGKLWLIGAAASYEMYLKFLSRFPSIEKDWDSQLLPITSLRPPLAESYSSSRSSLMESFVPFGGFFSTPSDLKSPLSGSNQCVSRCNLCNDKCELEVTALSKGVSTASVADQYHSSLPSWLQMAELGKNNGLDVEKAKDDGILLSAKVCVLQKKWDNICHSLHHSQLFPEASSCQVDSQVQTVVGFQFIKDRKENADNCSSSNTLSSPNGSVCKNVEIISSPKQSIHFPLVSKAKNESLMSKLLEKPSETEDLEPGGLRSSCGSFSHSSGGDGRTSPNSATSVTTDLGLGIFSSPTSNELKKPNQNNAELSQDDSGCFVVNVDFFNGSISNHPAQSSSCSSPDFSAQFDPRNAKMLFKALRERIGWQDEAASVISQTIAHCRTRNEKRHGAIPRGDIWFNFLGPDRFGKKKVAVALAEILYESKENFINVDLSSHDGIIHTNTLYHRHEKIEYDRKFRGKTVVDFIAEELSKKQLSVIYLENVDKADFLAQNSLSHAIRTGKFSDSCGREVSINNATIIVTTSDFARGNRTPSYQKDPAKYSEERISRAKGWPIQISLGGCAVGDNIDLNESLLTRQIISSPIFVNKRKLMGRNEVLEQRETLDIAKRAHMVSNLCLDLNLPAEDIEVHETDYGNFDHDSGSENSKAWLEDFFNQVDETVVFKPFDLDALAEKMFKEINESFHKIVGSECLLEIDSKVIDQILAAGYVSSRNRVVEDWVKQVLSKGFAEAKKRYNLTAHSVVKLVACDDPFSEEQAPYLPPRIILN